MQFPSPQNICNQNILIARKSLILRALTNGVPIESVSKMLGHKSLRTTKIYTKILDSKVSVDMQKLREKFAGN